MYGTRGYSKTELIELIEKNFSDVMQHEVICIETYGNNQMQSFMFVKHLDETPGVENKSENMCEQRNITKEEEGKNYRPCYICLCERCSKSFCKEEECNNCTSESDPVITCDDFVLDQN